MSNTATAFAATIFALGSAEVSIPKAPRTPWASLEQALVECEQATTAAAKSYIDVKSTLSTVRPGLARKAA